MQHELAEKIDASDLLIIGIGKEWDWVRMGIRSDPRYDQFIEYCNLEGNQFLFPVLEYEYALYNPDPKIEDAYKGLKKLVGDKKCFIISENFLQDACLYGFKPEFLVNPCGNYRFLQSSNDQEELWEAKEIPEFMELVERIHKIITELNGNLGNDSSFSQIFFNGKELYLNQKRQEYSKIKYNENSYKKNWDEYMKYLSDTLNKKLLILELGVSLDYPTVIRWPFEKVTFINKNAHLIRVHEKLFHHTPEISEKTESIQMNSVDYILQESNGL